MATSAGGESGFSANFLNHLTPTKITPNSPLVRLGPVPFGVGLVATPPSNSPIAMNAAATGGKGYDYGVTEVGEIDRAPMAMFEHNGELIISPISRNGMRHTPVWSLGGDTGVMHRSNLPEAAESGHYGYSLGGELYLTPESWGGPITYRADSADGPWEKLDFTHLVPHQYTNLKWGFAYQCPVTGREFMGFGNTDHPGMVITKNQSGDWELFSAPEDMRFPNAMAVINSGPHKGSVLVSSNYGGSRLHMVSPEGETKLLRHFEGWGGVRADHANRIVYQTSDKGRVWWASFDDLDTWTECKYESASGPIDRIQVIGEANIHPQTGNMIFPAIDEKEGATWVYEARRDNGEVTLKEIANIRGAGVWAGKSAAVGNDFYIGTGKDTGLASDRTPGGIYKLDAICGNKKGGDYSTEQVKPTQNGRLISYVKLRPNEDFSWDEGSHQGETRKIDYSWGF